GRGRRRDWLWVRRGWRACGELGVELVGGADVWLWWVALQTLAEGVKKERDLYASMICTFKQSK
ncbi:hypothetical protein A2U01_0107392, partial [Trifolium medium]|nr:hypothetical protein [Trifolium medium]